MLKCAECGKSFPDDQAGYESDSVDFWGSTCRLPGFPICPFCGSDELENIDDGHTDNS